MLYEGGFWVPSVLGKAPLSLSLSVAHILYVAAVLKISIPAGPIQLILQVRRQVLLEWV